MNMNPDMAQKISSEKFRLQGMDLKRAALLGKQIADYVFNWSMAPMTVYRRVAWSLQQKGVPDEEAMAKASAASKLARQKYGT